MGSYRRIFGEVGQELGFSMEDGRLILHLSNDNSAMRRDVANIGADMRRVIERADI